MQVLHQQLANFFCKGGMVLHLGTESGLLKQSELNFN